MRIGQPVTIASDVYGSAVKYQGKIQSLGIGTGSAFSLLPAQNATGNWIKIVQRVPVRIALTPRELAAHPLQIGLSMKVEVDVYGGADGARLPQLASAAPAYATDVFDSSDALAAARVQAIIAANQSLPVAAAPAVARHPAGTTGLLAASHLVGAAHQLH